MMKKFIPLNYMHLFNNEKNRKKYLEKSFVAVLNNQSSSTIEDLKKQYKERVTKLDRFVTVSFKKDAMVTPLNSQTFGFYCDANPEKLCSRSDLAWYKDDLLGIKHLLGEGKFFDIPVNGGHLQLDEKEWKNLLEYFKPELKKSNSKLGLFGGVEFF